MVYGTYSSLQGIAFGVQRHYHDSEESNTMSRLLASLSLILVCFIVAPLDSRAGHVKGYTKKNGSHVSSYHRNLSLAKINQSVKSYKKSNGTVVKGCQRHHSKW